ncbi:transcription-repair coupling factor [Celerinatantimonas diazotrophica]|uniref:Transcription-repair-coupling factor n=2 Tax=Celerinatantimonas diazotrophica TaxID=412034 RepID=A0A4R1J7Q3_9GAMM|nr:transcription-repair coupling factor [Celerinatantimonas diazotrophica]TCK46569.1 transcription-repair coupling factor [Celerinatantimonas diazotrophica]CAG9296619.1 Transcription-repair-coupling factor [Celerinatantimonas diazotrophica]
MTKLLPHFSLPEGPGDHKRIGQLPGSSIALAVYQYIHATQAPIIILTPDTRSAIRLEHELNGLNTGREIALLPDWETLPYDQFSPHQEIISTRLRILSQMFLNPSSLVVIATVATWMMRCAPKSYILGRSFSLKTSQQLDIETFRANLVDAGYQQVDQVIEHGEFAIRGSLLDIFPMGSDDPYRIDFFDDEIDTIRSFDPDDQRSRDTIEQINLLPAHEFPTDSKAIENFRSRWRERFDVPRESESIYQQVSKGIWPAGIEYYLPLFHESTSTISQLMPEDLCIITIEDINDAAQQFWHNIQERYENRRHDRLRPLLEPNELYQNVDQCFATMKQFARLSMQQHAWTAAPGRVNLELEPLPDIAFNHQLSEATQKLRQFIEKSADTICFVVESAGRREALSALLKPLKLPLKNITSLEQLTGENRFYLFIAPLEQGFRAPSQKLIFIGESDLLGKQVVRNRSRKSHSQVNPDAMIRNLAELSIGQPVVHLEHGVGRYQGLNTLDAGGVTTEFLTLLYANDAKLYVPVSSLHLISRYSGSSEDSAPLNKLGSDAWQKARKKAAEKVRDVAAELLNIYAKRAAKPGYPFKLSDDDYQQFCSEFPFEETDDQVNAINAVVGDMSRPEAMDRLVCGDVGFGKTEVAMRGAFVAVSDNKQVAVLVPTTLLAQQHYDNFCDRFANWPVRIEVLSRFKTAKQQSAILQDLADGKIDIVIGTHKLLSKNIKFADLGLLIVDEEHRFGVRHKEKIKAMRADVDILTLTATPIPRTLNMAMSGMRDLSIIATPPARRLSVKTFVRRRDDALIKEAITREITRGGQVYFLHNNVETIDRIAQELQQVLPQARVGIGHGQMRERQLERVMSDFHHQRFNVLVCTTIIETGIDIPNANTIIIDRADHFGLAQLHQLRGRVGRSHHQAYAYLLTPHPKAMTRDAKLRLDAISELEDLGAGFTLATHDLEIRGAGELLGEEQSGQIEAVGFTLYMEMLERAVNALKSGKEPSLDLLESNQADVELKIPALLPDSYINDVNTRLSIYKRLANCENEQALRELQVELIDRFGLLPDAAKNLFSVQQLKQTATQLGLKRVEAGNTTGMIEFSQQSSVDPSYLVALLQKANNQYQMDGPTRLKFNVQSVDRREKMEQIKQLLNDFANHQLPEAHYA